MTTTRRWRPSGRLYMPWPAAALSLTRSLPPVSPRRRCPLLACLHYVHALHHVTISLQLRQRASSSNMRVGSSHGTEAEAQMKRLRSAAAALQHLLLSIFSAFSHARGCAFEPTHSHQAAHADAGLVEGRSARPCRRLRCSLWRQPRCTTAAATASSRSSTCQYVAQQHGPRGRWRAQL